MTARAPRLPSVDDRSGLGIIAQLPETHDPRLARFPSVADKLRAVRRELLADPTIADPEVRIWQALGTTPSHTRAAMQFQLARIRVVSLARTINAIELALDHHRDAHHPACDPEDFPCCSMPYWPGPSADRLTGEPADAECRRRERARITAIEALLARRRA